MYICVFQMSEKESVVRAVWGEGYGVVSLHVFHNTIPAEAHTREAAIIAAIGEQ